MCGYKLSICTFQFSQYASARIAGGELFVYDYTTHNIFRHPEVVIQHRLKDLIPKVDMQFLQFQSKYVHSRRHSKFPPELRRTFVQGGRRFLYSTLLVHDDSYLRRIGMEKDSVRGK